MFEVRVLAVGCREQQIVQGDGRVDEVVPRVAARELARKVLHRTGEQVDVVADTARRLHFVPAAKVHVRQATLREACPLLKATPPSPLVGIYVVRETIMHDAGGDEEEELGEGGVHWQ